MMTKNTQQAGSSDMYRNDEEILIEIAKNCLACSQYDHEKSMVMKTHSIKAPYRHCVSSLYELHSCDAWLALSPPLPP